MQAQVHATEVVSVGFTSAVPLTQIKSLGDCLLYIQAFVNHWSRKSSMSKQALNVTMCRHIKYQRSQWKDGTTAPGDVPCSLVPSERFSPLLCNSLLCCVCWPCCNSRIWDRTRSRSLWFSVSCEDKTEKNVTHAEWTSIQLKKLFCISWTSTHIFCIYSLYSLFNCIVNILF